jgi:undecaprenyl pyrophosphate phosphatase UppP
MFDMKKIKELCSMLCSFTFSVWEVINIKKTTDNKGTADSQPAQTPRKGSTRVGCVSAIVVGNFLYINIYELAFNQRIVVALCIFLVLMLDLYEWNSGQESYKIHSSETKLGANRSCQN